MAASTSFTGSSLGPEVGPHAEIEQAIISYLSSLVDNMTLDSPGPSDDGSAAENGSSSAATAGSLDSNRQSGNDRRISIARDLLSYAFAPSLGNSPSAGLSTQTPSELERIGSMLLDAFRNGTPSTVARACAFRKRGNQAMEQRKFAQAIAHYSMGIGMTPGNPVLYSNRSAAFLQVGDFEAAEDDALTAIELVEKVRPPKMIVESSVLSTPASASASASASAPASASSSASASFTSSTAAATRPGESPSSSESTGSRDSTRIKRNRVKFYYICPWARAGFARFRAGKLDSAISAYEQGVQIGQMYLDAQRRKSNSDAGIKRRSKQREGTEDSGSELEGKTAELERVSQLTDDDICLPYESFTADDLERMKKTLEDIRRLQNRSPGASGGPSNAETTTEPGRAPPSLPNLRYVRWENSGINRNTTEQRTTPFPNLRPFNLSGSTSGSADRSNGTTNTTTPSSTATNNSNNSNSANDPDTSVPETGTTTNNSTGSGSTPTPSYTDFIRERLRSAAERHAGTTETTETTVNEPTSSEPQAPHLQTAPDQQFNLFGTMIDSILDQVGVDSGPQIPDDAELPHPDLFVDLAGSLRRNAASMTPYQRELAYRILNQPRYRQSSAGSSTENSTGSSQGTPTGTRASPNPGSSGENAGNSRNSGNLGNLGNLSQSGHTDHSDLHIDDLD